ncbi:Imm41 family immunity protein [Desulfoluna spongiiphila]|uniref:Imm41 family immunity protein n=1 Tax=Desulfoluna spongiiphila TaxID=419481 RepID=UPI00125FDBFC|nr:Imm41 family immunity protein [Desulfoluna spongiiphila]
MRGVKHTLSTIKHREFMNILLSNFPHCSDFSNDSFIGIFHESCVWDEAMYWELDKEIFDLSLELSGQDIPREISWPLMRIFSFLMMSIQSHYNKNDGFEISNLDEPSLFDWRERLQLVVEGFFSGKMPNNTSFEFVNPLLETGD